MTSLIVAYIDRHSVLAEICGQPAPSPQPVETSQAQPELESVSQDGFLPAKKGSGKPKMARTDSSREQPPSLSEELKQSCTAAHTAEDWQHLYASWQTQVQSSPCLCGLSNASFATSVSDYVCHIAAQQ